MTNDKASKTYNKGITVIRHRGQPNKAQLPNGTWVHKQDKFFVEEWGGFVNAAQYSDHFIFQLPDRIRGSTFQCSCGSISVMAGLSGYVLDASPQGKILLCYHHATFGVHATGGSRWI